MVNICSNFVRYALPVYCQLCARESDTQHAICTACRAELSLNTHFCACCAQPIYHITATNDLLCGQCQIKRPLFKTVVAPFLYEKNMQSLIGRFKFRGDLSSGRLLSNLFLDETHAIHLTRPEGLIPVPLHTDRLQERGFNQALELSKPIAKRLNLPIYNNIARRSKSLIPQSQLSRKSRLANMRHAFTLQKKKLPEHLVIVDDVLTTGATTEALASALIQSGCKRVDVWVIARTP